jgi:hypothetical protein
MHPERIDSPSADAIPAIEAKLAAGQRLIVQFAAEPYSPTVLSTLNRLALDYGDRLEVRFYGHYGSAFDCTTLEQLHDVVSLSLDCLSRTENVERLASLERLKRLSLGVFDLANGTILKAENLRSLSELTLGETRKNVFDLDALASYSELSFLRVCGHTRNLEVLGDLRSIQTLWLNSIPKAASLEFISQMRGLRSLHCYLGGRVSLAPVLAPGLEVLEVVRVRGLQDLGDIARFPALTRLLVEDQIQLEQIGFGPKNLCLQKVEIYNCKSLRALPGIETLPQVVSSACFERQSNLLRCGVTGSLRHYAPSHSARVKRRSTGRFGLTARGSVTRLRVTWRASSALIGVTNRLNSRDGG